MLVYTVTPAATLTTSGSINTEVDHLFVAAGVRTVGYQSMAAFGKGVDLAALNAIELRFKHWTTASTAGTGVTPAPADVGFQAAKATAAHGPTQGSGGGTYHGAYGCGAAGPGAWTAPNPASRKSIEGGSGDSKDIYSISAKASLTFGLSCEIVE